MSDLDLARVEREADVVGITAMGPQIRRAYDLADHFRARGKKVRRYDADALVALLAEHGLTLEGSAMFGMEPRSGRFLDFAVWGLTKRPVRAMR